MADTGTKALSTTAARLHTGQSCNEVCINNDDASIAILVGFNSTTQSFKVAPNTNSGAIQVRNLNQVWVKSASGTPTCSYRWT